MNVAGKLLVAFDECDKCDKKFAQNVISSNIRLHIRTRSHTNALNVKRSLVEDINLVFTWTDIILKVAEMNKVLCMWPISPTSKRCPKVKWVQNCEAEMDTKILYV